MANDHSKKDGGCRFYRDPLWKVDFFMFKILGQQN